MVFAFFCGVTEEKKFIRGLYLIWEKRVIFNNNFIIYMIAQSIKEVYKYKKREKENCTEKRIKEIE